MKKLAILLTLLMSSLCNAQHCPYDGAAIIVVKIHERGNENTIQNLRVTLVKKKKDKIVNDAAYVLTQNGGFPFLSDEYSVIVPNRLDMKNYYLKIESVCEYRDNELSYFKTTENKLDENDLYPLCGNYDSSEYSTVMRSEGRIYHPLEIILDKVSCEENN